MSIAQKVLEFIEGGDCTRREIAAGCGLTLKQVDNALQYLKLHDDINRYPSDNKQDRRAQIWFAYGAPKNAEL